jgi:uncharacterized delta-60 repeat protein
VLIKNKNIYLIIIAAVSLFAADSVKAVDVIEGWVARYNGPLNSDDSAYAIAVDGSDNIYVTGASESNYVTIKYDSAGNEIWVKKYNGPSNSDDSASAIAVDGSGNVYVTGSSTGSGSDYDYATIKYDSNGTELWVRRYDGTGNSTDYVHGMAVDSSGNVYVTGGSIGSGTGPDYATIKYDSAGNQKWVSRYNNGPVNGGDVAYAIAVDSSGNVYVTGTSLTSGNNADYATVKYDSAGTQKWVSRYAGPGIASDTAYAIAVDGSGNIYVTGESYGAGTDYDYATIKYNNSGVQQWVSRYNGPGNGSDSAYSIAVDGSGNIYVTGGSYGAGTNSDYATIKYNNSGVLQWARRYNGPGNNWDGANSLKRDRTGNIYVTGAITGSGSGYDFATIKYDSLGNTLWTLTYNGPANGTDYATAMAIDDVNNIYVTGQSVGSTLSSDYTTIQYNQNPPVILTMQTEPAEVNTVSPPVGDNLYAKNVMANISARRFVGCPDVYVFNHWVGDVSDPNSANTTIVMDTDKTVTAVFVDGRQCGDECHPYPVVDYDKDCEVTFADFAFFASHWLECTKPECD